MIDSKCHFDRVKYMKVQILWVDSGYPLFRGSRYRGIMASLSEVFSEHGFEIMDP